jgi:hypothetical protein
MHIFRTIIGMVIFAIVAYAIVLLPLFLGD